MDHFVIEDLPIPVMPGSVERIERSAMDERAFPGNLFTSTLWETSEFAVDTAFLTNAEAAEIRRRCAFGREVVCSGSLIDISGGTLLCVIRVIEGAFVTRATDDGSGVWRTLSLLVRAVNEPLGLAWAPGVSLSEATFTRATTATYIAGP